MKKIILLLIALSVFIVACEPQATMPEPDVSQEVSVEEPPKPEVYPFLGEEIIEETPVEEVVEEEKVEVKEEPIEETKEPTKEETIALCDSLCEVDEQEYCSTQRSFELDDNTVTGSCRAFAKKGNVEGFSRCQKFCTSNPKSETLCTVDGKTDRDCDGIVG